MGTSERKARKRAAVKFAKAQKVPSRPWSRGRPKGLGLVSGAEILASLVVAGRL